MATTLTALSHEAEVSLPTLRKLIKPIMDQLHFKAENRRTITEKEAKIIREHLGIVPDE
ncbi:MAG: hypothetical protein K9H64_11410 [Bacteroidales bacterium]|nr:hypothetical protein [Bacteroidales bacterium]MCF8456559.1 hypothetical protein [Bacteroidales bacterium]